MAIRHVCRPGRRARGGNRAAPGCADEGPSADPALRCNLPASMALTRTHRLRPPLSTTAAEAFCIGRSWIRTCEYGLMPGLSALAESCAARRVGGPRRAQRCHGRAPASQSARGHEVASASVICGVQCAGGDRTFDDERIIACSNCVRTAGRCPWRRRQRGFPPDSHNSSHDYALPGSRQNCSLHSSFQTHLV